MIKIYQTEDEGFGRIEINSAIKKDFPKLDKDMDFFHFDANFDSLQSLVDEATMMSFSMSTKVILLTGTQFLTKVSKKGGPSKDEIQAFARYCETPNPDTALYILVVGKVMKGDILKSLKKTSSFFDVSSPTDSDYVQYGQYLANKDNKTIDKESCLMIKERVGGDFYSFLNSVRILLLYTDNVRADDVKMLIQEPLQDNIFGLTDLLLSGNVTGALSLYRDLISGGALPLSILPLLMSQFRFLYEVCYLRKKKLNQTQIADELNVKPGRVRFALEKSGRINSSLLLIAMSDLAKVEDDIKFERDDDNLRMELYILGFKKYLK